MPVVLSHARVRRYLEGLSDDKLMTIVKTQDYAKLNPKFIPHLPPSMTLFRSSYEGAYDQALEWAISNSSMPLDSFFYITICVTIVGDIGLAIVTGLFGLTAMFGLYNYFSGRVHFQEQKQENIHDFQLLKLQLLAADEFIARLRKETGDREPMVAEAIDNAPKTTTCIKLKSSFWKGLGTSITLGMGYYVSAAFILDAIEVTAVATAMLSPMGLGIAIGVSVLIGIYCGYKYYKGMEANQLIDDRKEKLASKLRVKRDECMRLSGVRYGMFGGVNPSRSVDQRIDNLDAVIPANRMLG